MSSLLHLVSGRRAWLGPRSVVGRAAVARIRPTHPRVSQEHALLRFTDGCWIARDLGSRNGTWLGAARLAPGIDHPVMPGDVFTFGDPGERWTFESGGPPVAFAVRLADRAEHGAASGFLTLPPDLEPPLVTLFRASGGWLTDVGCEPRPIRDGETVQADGPWQVHLPVVPELTTERGERVPSLTTATLELERSRDGLVRLAVRDGDLRLNLGHRRPWVLLWVLGRQLLRDAELPEHDRGWLDVADLAHRADMELTHVDVNISRARSGLAEAGIEQAADVVVARARTGQRRIGVRGDQLDLRR